MSDRPESSRNHGQWIPASHPATGAKTKKNAANPMATPGIAGNFAG